jgi:hypothetical protein
VAEVLEGTRLARLLVEFEVAAVLLDGTATTVTGVDVAMLPWRATPTGATLWTPAAYDAGVASILAAWPDADPTGAIQVPATGGGLWGRVIDVPEVLVALIARFVVI